MLEHDRAFLAEKKAIFDEVVQQGGNIPPAKLQMEIAQEELDTKFKSKVEREIYETLSKVLDRWRCSGHRIFSMSRSQSHFTLMSCT